MAAIWNIGYVFRFNKYVFGNIITNLFHNNVLASQSPLGHTSGSLTPPPTMGSASNLQLGLMSSANNSNRGLMNAAPGAESMSKFRASGMYSEIH